MKVPPRRRLGRLGHRRTERLLTCSFCGKGRHKVRKLIAGPGVYICDECVGLCNEILAES